jgi:hypothetical protein
VGAAARGLIAGNRSATWRIGGIIAHFSRCSCMAGHGMELYGTLRLYSSKFNIFMVVDCLVQPGRFGKEVKQNSDLECI